VEKKAEQAVKEGLIAFWRGNAGGPLPGFSS
jgi:hypothetical protein